MAPVLRRMALAPGLTPLVCVTAQHREMLDQVLGCFAIRPDCDLNLMRPGAGLNSLSAAVLARLDQVFAELRPDWVLVQGDTSSALAAALAAAHARLPVAHIEAGLRTGRADSPWPEEMNRRLIAQVAARHFCPTAQARSNLLREGIAAERITVTGNTGIDALLDTIALLDADPRRRDAVEAALPALRQNKRLILVTGHRRENLAGGLARVADGLARLADRGDVEIVFPLHLNPEVRRAAIPRLSNRPGIHLTEPLEYLPFVQLMRRSAIIITDSGGVQEEAPSLGKPVIVTRDTTERPEAVEAGTAELVGTDADRLFARTSRLLDDDALYARRAVPHHPFGDGKAASRIVDALLHA